MKRRVLHVAALAYPTRQGTQASIRSMLRAHVQRGDETHLLAYAHGDGRQADAGVTLHRALDVGDRSLRSGPSWRKLAADAALAWRVRELARLLAPATIVAHHVEAAAACMVALAPSQTPWTFVAHTGLGAELPGYFSRRAARWLELGGDAVERSLVQNAPRVAAISPMLARHLSALHARDVRAWTLPWQTMTPAATMSTRAEARSALDIDARARVLLYAGNFDDYQGIDVMCEALAHPSLRDVQVIVASNDARPFPIARVRRFALDDRMPLLLRAADVGLAPRKTLGGISVKLLDYLAHELPTVAAPLALGGHTFETGIHQAQSDAESWRETLRCALNKPSHVRAAFANDAWSAAHFVENVHAI